MTLASMPMMLLLAAMLSAELNRHALIAVCAYSMLWLLALAIWAASLRSRRAQIVAVATALLLAGGGAFAAYLNREFGGQAQAFDWTAPGYFGPIVGAMTLLESGARTGTAWFFLGSLVAAALLAFGAVRMSASRLGKMT